MNIVQQIRAISDLNRRLYSNLQKSDVDVILESMNQGKQSCLLYELKSDEIDWLSNNGFGVRKCWDLPGAFDKYTVSW